MNSSEMTFPWGLNCDWEGICKMLSRNTTYLLQELHNLRKRNMFVLYLSCVNVIGFLKYKFICDLDILFIV